MSAAAIFGREPERAELDARLRTRRSFVLCAPGGMGKTLLIRSLLAPRILYCPMSNSREGVFTSLWRQLEPPDGSSRPPRSALGARGRVRDALGRDDCVIILDHLRPPSTVFATALRELAQATGTALVAVARSPHMEELGALHPLYPGRDDRYELPPLAPPEAESFLDWRLSITPVPAANLSQFRQQALSAAAGNPGLLLAILDLARNDRYWRRGQILFTPLWIDLRLGSATPSRAAAPTVPLS